MKKIYSLILAASLCLSLGIPVVASDRQNPLEAVSGSDDILSAALSIFSSDDEFGGIYYEGDTLVINVVSSNEISMNPLPISADSNVEYRLVTYALQDLEEVKDFLTPYMYDNGVTILDANEVTNQVDIYLNNYSTTNIESIKSLVAENYGKVDYLNFIDRSKVTNKATVAYEDFDINAQLSDEKLPSPRASYFSGAKISIGNGGYTLGPILSSTKAYSAGHNFSGTATVYDTNGFSIGTASSHYGGSAGDWSNVNIPSATYSGVVSRGTPIVGTSIYMFGAYSGQTTGKITFTNVNVSANAPYATLTGMCVGNYRCTFGDSGAGLFSAGASSVVGTTNKYSTYGIQSSADFDSSNNWAGMSYFTPISKVS